MRARQASPQRKERRSRPSETPGTGPPLSDAEALARWWPSVYLEVREIGPSGPRGVGQRVRLYTKGWLPYTLRWDFEVVESKWADAQCFGEWVVQGQPEPIIVELERGEHGACGSPFWGAL